MKKQTKSSLRSMMGVLEADNEDMDVHEKEPNRVFVVAVTLMSVIIIIKTFHAYLVHWFR